MPSVQSTLSADASKYAQEMARATKAIEKHTAALGDLTAKADKAAQRIDKHQKEEVSGSERAINSLARQAAAYLSISTAIQVVNRALQDKLELERQIAQQQVTEASSQRDFLINLAEPQNQAKRLAQIEQIAMRHGMARKDVLQVASNVMSARGSLTSEQAMSFVDMAVRVRPDRADEAIALGGGLIDMSKLTGVSDPARNMGMMLGMQKQGRVTSLKQTAEHLIQGAIGVKQNMGGTGTDAAAFLTTLTNLIPDPEGRISSTAAIRYSQEMREFYKGLEEQIFLMTGISGVMPNTFEEGRKALSENMGLYKLWERTGGKDFEAKAMPGLEMLTLPHKLQQKQLFAAGLGKFFIMSPQQLLAQNQAEMRKLDPNAVEELMQSVESTPEARVARLGRMWDSAKETALKERGAAAAALGATPEISELRRALGDSLFERWGQSLLVDAPGRAFVDDQQLLEARTGELMARAKHLREIGRRKEAAALEGLNAQLLNEIKALRQQQRQPVNLKRHGE